MFFFFFFQAADGIRDYKVTGVQTCALPIWLETRERDRAGSSLSFDRRRIPDTTPANRTALPRSRTRPAWHGQPSRGRSGPSRLALARQKIYGAEEMPGGRADVSEPRYGATARRGRCSCDRNPSGRGAGRGSWDIAPASREGTR